MQDSGTFVKTLLPANANDIILLVDFNQVFAPWKEFEADYIVRHRVVLEDFQAKIFLSSLLEAPWPDTNALASESAQQAAWDKIKKEGQKVYLEVYHAYGNGPWQIKGEEILQNKNSLELPWALMAPLFSTNETALLDASLKIGVRIAPKAQGIGGLKGNDYIRIFGSWWSNSSREKKKDDGIETLRAEVEALQLAIYGKLTGIPANTLLGRGALPGIVETIPNNFITATQSQSAIEQAIFDLAGTAPLALNTLVELSNAMANDPNFAATITNQLALKAPIANPAFTGFSSFGNAIFGIKIKKLTGILATAQGGTITILHGMTSPNAGSKIAGFIVKAAAGSGNHGFPPNHKVNAGYEYDILHDDSKFHLTNSLSNSANLLNNVPVTIIVIYTE